MESVSSICTSVATTVLQDLINKAKEQIKYLRIYQSYVKDLENIKGKMSAIIKSIEEDLNEAAKSNMTEVNPTVEEWLKRANNLLKEGEKPPTKCFGLCTNCFSQISRSKELEKLINQSIPNMILEVKEFPEEIARLAGVPGMEFISQEFISFEGREAKFTELIKYLEDESNFMIGLYGMGGTGKSTMAIEVGKLVAKSKAFDKVIFIVVSTPIDEKNIRDGIAKQLELPLEEEKFLTHAQQIWNRIANVGKVLVILDDVWEKLNLENMGIQAGFHNKSRCTVLITTRYEHVCTQMGCQKIIRLDVLDEKDALHLFLSHAIGNYQDRPDDLKDVAKEFVNECGRLPVLILPLTMTLKDWPPNEWRDALVALRNSNVPSKNVIIGENAIKFYKSMNFSYTHLKDAEAQVLFLLCSSFPKAYEIPIELLSIIAVGSGLFGEVDNYHAARSQVNVKKNKLINSTLLLKASEECIKMHDVVREVAHEIASEEIHVIMDLKENVKYSSRIKSVFPDCYVDCKHNVLLVWINANDSLEVSSTLFQEMKSLKVLLLYSKIPFGRTSALSLPKSVQFLENIRTLSLTNWEFDDISMLVRKLQKLQSLELTNCSIIELPNELSELDKLRFLCLIRCSIQKKNPFEVISRCSQLEELYYASNDDHINVGEEGPQVTSLPKYKRYCIDGSHFSFFDTSHLGASTRKIFKPGKLQKIFSNKIIKSLASTAEILELKEDDEMSWNNLFPDIVSIEDGAMKDLIKLSLESWSKIDFLISTKHLQLESRVTIFPKLVELKLDDVGVKEICCGHYPNGFLKELKKLVLHSCLKLEGALFKEKIELGNLKSIGIYKCSITFLFHSSTAQSLRHLETLEIFYCPQLKSIIWDEGSSLVEKVDEKDLNLSYSMFPQLKLLIVEMCTELEFIFPIHFCEDLPLLERVVISNCRNVRYMFGQYPKDGGLHQMQNEKTLPSLRVISIEGVPLYVNIYPECYLPQKTKALQSERSNEEDKSSSDNVSSGPLCCFLPRSKATNENDPSTSNEVQQDHTAYQKEKYVCNVERGFFTPPLYPCNLREMTMTYISNLRSLFTVSIATSMSLLESLIVIRCETLENIVAEEVNGHDHVNANSIFPKLQSIKITYCGKLKYVFPASCSTKLVHLESVFIKEASQLEYVFGKSGGDDNSLYQKHAIEINLPSLNSLTLATIPNMVNVCPQNYHVKAPFLKGIDLTQCSQLPINYFIDSSIEQHTTQDHHLSGEKLMGMQLGYLKSLGFHSLDMETIYDLQRLENVNPVNSCLETLILQYLNDLKNICVGPDNLHMSFKNLFKLKISGCQNLTCIFSASILISLPCLRHLEVSNCDSLHHIIDDSCHHEHQHCFPNLYRVSVKGCVKLRSLFSISKYGSLPQLSTLSILDAPNLEVVFDRNEEGKKLDIKDVFPKLFMIILQDLPILVTICPTIDFQTEVVFVNNCPLISLTSNHDEVFADFALWFGNSNREEAGMDEDHYYENAIERFRAMSENVRKRDPKTAQQNNCAMNIMETSKTIVEESPTSEEAIEADQVKDLDHTNTLVAVALPSQTESPEISDTTSNVKEQLPTSNAAETPSSMSEKIMETTKAAVEESPTSEEAIEADQVKDLDHTNTLAAFALHSQTESPKSENGCHLKSKESQSKSSDFSSNTTSSQSNEASVGDASNRVPSTTTETKSPLIPATTTPRKTQVATSSTNVTASDNSQSDVLDVHITEPTQDELKVTELATCMPCVSKQLEDDDLLRLFQIAEEGAGIEFHVSKISARDEDHSEVTKALADLEASLKMGLNEIADSEERILCLENALNILSSHCSHDALKATLHSLQQEIQTILSSFKQAHATIDTSTKLEEKEKLMIANLAQRKEVAKTLVSDIDNTQNSILKAQKREEELKEQISSLQAELYDTENEIKERGIELLSLQDQKKKIFSDDIGFIIELQELKRERSNMVEQQKKARHQLENNVHSHWSSCLANLKTTSLLLGVHLKHML